MKYLLCTLMTQCWFRVYISVCINTMSYYANLDDVQTYIMNYVVASKSVLVKEPWELQPK